MFRPRGFYTVEIERSGQVIHSFSGENAITNEGLQHLLNRFFRGPATVALEPDFEEEVGNGWFIGFIREKADLSATTISVDDTGQTHDFETFSNITWINGVSSLPVWKPASVDYGNILRSVVRNKVTVTADAPRLLGMCIKQYGERTFLKQDPGPPYADHWAVLWAATIFGYGPIEVKEDDIISVTYEIVVDMGEA